MRVSTLAIQAAVGTETHDTADTANRGAVQNVAALALPILQCDPLPLLTLDPITNRLAFHEELCHEFKMMIQLDAISGLLTNSNFYLQNLQKSRESSSSLCQKQIAQRMQTASIDAQENSAQLQSAAIVYYSAFCSASRINKVFRCRTYGQKGLAAFPSKVLQRASHPSGVLYSKPPMNLMNHLLCLQLALSSTESFIILLSSGAQAQTIVPMCPKCSKHESQALES